MTGRKYRKAKSERIAGYFTTVGLSENHKNWLKEHQEFNLSLFVRECLDKLISEGITTPKGEKEE